MSRDLRRYARQTNWRLLIGFVLLLFVVGDGLILYLYGRAAAITGLLCLLGGLGLLALVGAMLWLMDWVVKRANRYENEPQRYHNVCYFAVHESSPRPR